MLNLAKSKTRGQNRSKVVVHNVDLGEHRTVCTARALRDHELYRCAPRDRAGPFDVEVGFSFLLFTDNAGVSAIHDDRWIVYRQTILSPEPSDVVHIQVASTNNSDGLASTIESLIP